MVWRLSPFEVYDPGNGQYYFTAPGTYTVGRKGCAVTIQTDKTISRVHAEIVVEPGVAPANGNTGSGPRSQITLKDLSKFGTFVNKEAGSHAVSYLPGSIVRLQDEDVIQFGTNKTAFRLQHIPIVLCVASSAFEGNRVALEKLGTAIGTYIHQQWDQQCTHLVVEESSPVTDLVISAVVSKKPVVSSEWLQALAGLDSPSNELPSFARYPAQLRLESKGAVMAVSIAEPVARKNILAGLTVVMENESLYHYRDLQRLIETGGAAVKIVKRDDIKDIAVPQNSLLLLPRDVISRKVWLGSKNLSSIQQLQAVCEDDLVRSILTATFNPASLNIPPSPTASVDTDETVEEDDLQDERDSANSVVPSDVQVQVLAVQSPPSGEVVQREISSVEPSTWQPVSMESTEHHESKLPGSSSSKPSSSKKLQSQVLESTTCKDERSPGSSIPGSLIRVATQSQRAGPVKHNAGKSVGSLSTHAGGGQETHNKVVFEAVNKHLASSTDVPGQTEARSEMHPMLNGQSDADVIFSNKLVVAKNYTAGGAASDRISLNFKRFKKGQAVDGNSFSSLVPFAKEPYRESDYGREMNEYVKQERRRKEAERLSEDLFNAEQLKRKRVTAAEAARDAGVVSGKYGKFV